MPNQPDPLQSTELDPLDFLVEDYARLCRRGEQPSIEEYAAKHGAHAEGLRRLLPAVAFLEQGKSRLGRSGSRSSLSKIRASDAPPIRQLGENRVIRELGRGGMGIVYEAVQEPLGRRVAVKILPRHAHADVKSRERFLREAQVVARLRHPHIVPIHTVGEHEGIPYYVMPLIDGCGLDRLDADPKAALPVEPAERARRVAALGVQAAGALAYAHGQGILHRDIKPSNLLLDSAGTLWLADFGLAKLADDLSLSGSGDLPGTLRYLAPECLRDEADARSDIYSLGLTLYELLVGHPAFPELDRVRLLHRVASHDIPAPRSIVPGLPRDLETIILRAIAYDPKARYETAAALAEDLGRFLDGRPIQARRASKLEHLIRWGRRNPALAALTATSIILGLIAAIFIRSYLLAPPFPPPPFDPDFPGPGFDPPPHPFPHDRPPPPRRKGG
jgi:eukaryotic-like serine/threonine-protein kinase